MFLTLNEYLTGAKKILSIYGYNCHKNDEDAISFVASYMMKADQTWDGMSSSRDTWRFNQAKFAIMKLKTKKRNEKKLVSLSMPINCNDSRQKVLSDIIPSKYSIDFISDFKEVAKIAKQKLNGRQFDCLMNYYCHGYTLQEIGDMFGITRERARQIIKISLNIIRNEIKS